MIIKLNDKDLEQLVLIENACFSHPMSEKNILESLKNNNYYIYGFKNKDKIVAYASVFIISSEAYINNIAVLSEFRKQGIGKKLVLKLIEVANDNTCEFITLEVRESNSPAISLYEKLNFNKVANRKNYYSQPTENAIIMTKYFGENK